MPITELATLRLKAGNDWDSILPNVRVLELKQAKWSGYALHFFDVPDRPGEIVLLSGWQSVDAHSEWIASETNQSLRQSLLPSLDVTSLLHLTVEPSHSWNDARAMLYEQADGGEVLKGLATSKSIMWEGKGADVEGKVKGTFRLVAFNNAGAIGDLGKDMIDSEKARWLVRHDIPPAVQL